MSDEITKLLDDQKKAFEEFKKTNDDRLKTIETKGHAPADFEEKIGKINATLDATEKKLRSAMDEVEKKVNRLELGGAGTEDTEKKIAKERKAAFDRFLRVGEQKIGETERKVLQFANDTLGGVLGVPEFVGEIIKAEVLFSPMRGLVNVRQTSSAEVNQPKRTRTAAATRVKAEAATRSESQNPTWGMVKFTAPEMYAEARVTWADLEDSAFDLESLLVQEFSEQFGVLEGKEIISGTGNGECWGFLDSKADSGTAALAYTPSGVATTIAGAAAGSAGQADPIITLFHALKTAYAKNASWVLNRASLGKVRKLKDTTGQYLWQPGVGQSGTLNQGIAPTILGAPYTECPDMPDEGANAYPIAFGDWKRAYTIVDRVDMAVTRDPYTLASSGQVKIFARRRMGGQVVLAEAIQLLKCAVS